MALGLLKPAFSPRLNPTVDRVTSQNGTTLRRPFFFLCLLEDMAASMSLSSAVASPPSLAVRGGSLTVRSGLDLVDLGRSRCRLGIVNVGFQFIGIGRNVRLQFVRVFGGRRGAAPICGARTRAPARGVLHLGPSPPGFVPIISTPAAADLRDSRRRLIGTRRGLIRRQRSLCPSFD